MSLMSQDLMQHILQRLVTQYHLAIVTLVAQVVIIGTLLHNTLLLRRISRLNAQRHGFVSQAIDAIIKHQGFLDRRLTAIETGVYLDPGDEGI